MPNRRTVLVVDDHSTMRILLSRTIEKAGFIPVCCASGEDELAALIVNPAVILLDYHLSGASGVDIATKLKQQAATKSISIIFISADGTKSSESQAVSAGATAFLTKPFSPRLLIKLIQEAAGSAKSQ